LEKNGEKDGSGEIAAFATVVVGNINYNGVTVCNAIELLNSFELDSFVVYFDLIRKSCDATREFLLTQTRGTYTRVFVNTNTWNLRLQWHHL